MHLVIQLMALGTVVLDAIIALALFALARRTWRERLIALAQDYALMIVVALSVISVGGTLFLQYGDNLAPCVFCWWQRVCMYPIAILSVVAFIKNQRFSDIADYVSIFAILGGAIALYQHLLQILPSGSLIPCDAADECAVRSIFEFGFVTLPWMALTMFAALLLTALAARLAPKKL